ncbi:MAG: hypothetical protein ACK5PF_11345 [bacterium]|jgi:hypothetical protein
MSEFIGWPMFIIAVSIGGIVGSGLGWWAVSREINKAKKANRK